MLKDFLENTVKRETENEVRYRFNVLDHIGDSIFYIDPKSGDFVDFNKTVENQLGYSREELLSKNIRDVEVSLPIQTQLQWLEFIKKTKNSGSPLVIRGKHRCKDGRRFPVEMSVSYKSSLGWEYLLAIVRDISEREQARKIIESQQQQLIQADKMTSLGTMAAGVAHEINNPLNVAVGDIHLLRRDARDLLEFVNHISNISLPPDKLNEIEKLKIESDLPYILENFNKKISRCADAMGRIKEIVQNLRDFSHLDSGEINDSDINKSIERTLQLIPKKYKRDIEIKTEFASLPRVPCYGRQINQVFMNVAINAFQAMKDGGMLKIETLLNDRYIFIKFRDTGTGIPEDKIKKIFDPFYTTKPIGEGTGLGLAISYSIVEKHGGEMTVVNNHDKGVTFTIKLFKGGVNFPLP